MKSRFSEKDCSSTFTEINLVQSVNESTYDFVVRLMNNQEKVIVLVNALAIISILVIKQGVSHSYASGFEKTLPSKNFQRCRNCTATKSKFTHCFVCGSDDHRNSVCPHEG